MPNWKKVIVSGSDAVLGNITASNISASGHISASNFVGNFPSLNLQTVTDTGDSTLNQVNLNNGLSLNSGESVISYDSTNEELIINSEDDDITPVIRHFNGGVSSSFKEDSLSVNGKIITTEVESITDFLLDVEGDITFDANGSDILLKDNNVAFGRFKRANSDFIIKSEGKDKDIIFKGNDDGTPIDALRLDMSDSGSAIFHNNITASGNISASGAISAESLTIKESSSIAKFTESTGEVSLTLNPLGKWNAIRLNRDSHPKPIIVEGSITASANISASGHISASSFHGTELKILGQGSGLSSGFIADDAGASDMTFGIGTNSPLTGHVLTVQGTTAFQGNLSASGYISASEFIGLTTTAQTASYVLASNIDQPFTNITASGNISASGNIIANNITASNAFHAQAHSGFEFTISDSQFNMINQTENKSLFFKTSAGAGTINFGTNGNDSGVIVGPGNGNITASGDVRLSNGILSIPQFPNVSASLASLSSSLAVAPGTGNFKIESQSVFLGTNAGENQTAGLNPVTLVLPTSAENVGIGHQALQDITNGTNNVAIGYNVLSKNSTGFNNVAISKGALGNFTGSNTSIGIGFDAGAPYDDNSPEGGHIGNTIMGHQALNDFNIKSTAEISNNTAIGLRALRGLGGTTDPSFVNNVKNNTAIGRQAGLNIVHGTGGALNHNTFLGNSAGMNATPQQGNMLSNLLLGARAGMSGYIGSNNVVLQTATGDTALGNEGWGVSENISIGGRGALYSDNNIIISNASSSVTNTIGASDINTETKAINQSSNVIIGGYSNIISNVTNKTSRDNSIINSSTITIGGSTSTVSADDNFVGSAKGIIVQGDRNVLLGVELTDLDETQFFVGDKNTVINSTGFQLSNSTKQNTIIGSTGIEVANSTGKNAALHSQTIDFANSYENISIKSINTSYTGSNKSVALLDSNSSISGDSSVLINTTNITDDGSDNTYIGGSNHTIVGSSISGNIFIGGNNQTATGNGNDNIFLGATGGETSGSNNIVAGNTNYLGTNLKYSFIHGAQHNVRPHNASQRNIVVGFQHTFATGPAETITNSFIGGNRLMISSSNSFGYGKGLHIAYDNMGAFGKFNDSTANDASGSLFTVGCGPSTTIRRNAMNVVSATVNGSGNKAVVYLDQLVDFDFANDTAAAAAGIGVGGLYHTEGTVKIRTS